jgi:hypothetical protein
MDQVLESLDETAAEADGHRGANQPLHLELLQVVHQGLELLGVQHRSLLVHSGPTTGIRPVLDPNAGAGLSR